MAILKEVMTNEASALLDADAHNKAMDARCNNLARSPPITHWHARSVGEFMVSLRLAHLRNDLHKSLI